MKHVVKSEKGVSIFELAISLPFLVALTYSTLEISLKINSLQYISAAAQEGVKVAATYKPSLVSVCPKSNPRPVSVVCSSGGVENIPTDASYDKVAIITTCNYLKEQNIDASNFLITTTVEYKSFEGKEFPVIQLEMKERNPSCTLCINKLVSIIPGDSSASMSMQNCEPRS